MISKRTKCRRSDKLPGFTLIELLIVITIIAVLVVITIFASRKFLDKARQTKALNSIRQVAVANMSYSTENNGVINVLRVVGDPLEGRGGLNVADSYWGRLVPHMYPDINIANQAQLQQELKRRLDAFFGSPDTNTMADTFQRKIPIRQDGSGLPVPFAFSTYIAIDGQTSLTSTIADPAQTAYMTFGWFRFNETEMAAYTPSSTTAPGATDRRVDFFHDQKASVLFVDGHVERVSPPMPVRRFE